MSALLLEWRSRVLDLSARAEALIDYEEDVGDDPDPSLPDDISALGLQMARAVEAPPAERLRDGFKVVLAGPPNSGKSSLINYLAGRDVSIVTDEAGTTRDLVEVPVRIGDHAFVLIDSAGLRQAAGVVEAIGIDRSRAAMADADLVLWLGDAHDDRPELRRWLHVHSRSDLPGRTEPPGHADIAVSSVTGRGMEQLRRLLEGAANKRVCNTPRILLNARHHSVVTSCASILASRRPDIVLIAEQLRECRASLDEAIGGAGTEEMLNSLFSRFCVGK